MSILKGIRPSIPKSRYDSSNNKKVYTVNHNNPYTILLDAKENNSNLKSTVVAFREVNLANQFACALEDYKQRLHQWPIISVEEMNYMFFRDVPVNDSPRELDIVSWEKLILGSYCKHNSLDLLILSSLEHEQSTLTLQGILIQFPVDPDATIERLNNIYEYDSPNSYIE